MHERYPGGGGRARLRLPAGVYRVSSWLRPCSGNCGLLDPPTDRCSRRIRLLPHKSESVRALITVRRPGRDCTIRVRR